MRLDDYYGIIESCYGFTDESSPVGEAWAAVKDEVKRLNHERNVLCEAIDSFLANVGIIRKDALPRPPELIMFLQEDAEQMVRRLREENEKLGRALDNNIKCSEKTDTELFQANLKMAEMSIEMKRLREELSAFRKSEKELSDAYLRIRELVGAWDTKPGGGDRFEVTEAAVKRLREDEKRLDWLEKNLEVREILSTQRGFVVLYERCALGPVPKDQEPTLRAAVDAEIP